MDSHSVGGDEETSVGLSWLEIEAISLGLRTLLITQHRDEALCRVATSGLAKLPGIVPSDGPFRSFGAHS